MGKERDFTISTVRLGLSPEIEGKLHRAVSRIAEIASPQLVILFGPYAKGAVCRRVVIWIY